MKRILLGCGVFVLAVLLIFVAAACYFVKISDDSLSKKQIFSLVNKNYELLDECICAGRFSEIEEIKGVKDVKFDNGILDVYCGGRGFGSATNYYGFYYSPSNKPLIVWCGYISDGMGLFPDGKGYSKKNSNDDNCYYTEKIRDNFFYYESHF